jgi:endonuclease G
MKKLLLFLFLIPVLVFGQNREKVAFQNSLFKGEYSEVLEQPLWLEYKVLCPTGSASRKGMDFYTNDSIKTSNSADYVSNVYDKGHLAPAADFNCTPEMLYETFSYLNCALQNQYLNRGTWRLLEQYERKLASQGTVSVKIIIEFKGKCIKLPSGATVPSGFFKYITVNGKTTAFYFKNEKPLSSDYMKYRIQN